MKQVAALYVDPKGPYYNMPEVDCWDEVRDARQYAGPWPVVAHPPCGPWGKLRHLYRGDEHGLAPHAVDQVRTFGGVLEHPAHSKLWGYCDLPKPGDPVKIGYPFSVEVCQCDWGHVARKRTWLYCIGIPREVLRFPNPREPTHWCSGGGTGRGKTPPGIKVASAQQRRLTPPAFARWLVDLAKQARRP